MAKRIKTKQMSLIEYMLSLHNTDNLAYSSITKRIRENKFIPNVKSYKKYGTNYILNVCEKQISENN